MRIVSGDNMRPNGGKWGVAARCLPSVAKAMLDTPDLGVESIYDPLFRGQHLETYYFDTEDFALRKARIKGDAYATLRVRCYKGYQGHDYALDIKTDSEKWKALITENQADSLINGVVAFDSFLPANIYARILDIVGDDQVRVAACVHAHRYAVENQNDRITLDTHVHTGLGKCLPYSVLEWKTREGDDPPGTIEALNLPPIKMSKFLWATNAEG